MVVDRLPLAGVRGKKQRETSGSLMLCDLADDHAGIFTLR